jgi:hypothetical protein
MLLKFMDATKIHVPEDWIIVEMTEKAFKKAFFHKDHQIIRSDSALYWLNNDYRLVFCCKRDGSNENSRDNRRG